MNRDVFANAIVTAYHQRAAGVVHVQVLRHAADYSAFADFVIAAERCATFDDRPGCKLAAVADYRAGLDNAPRADDNVAAKLCPRVNQSGGMNLGHGNPFLGQVRLQLNPRPAWVSHRAPTAVVTIKIGVPPTGTLRRGGIMSILPALSSSVSGRPLLARPQYKSRTNKLFPHEIVDH